MNLKIYNSNNLIEFTILRNQLQEMLDILFDQQKDSQYLVVNDFVKQLEETINDYEKTDPRPFTQSLL